MYLLIPYPKISAKLLRLLFTFHNVSINSLWILFPPVRSCTYLHSIMYLLILWFGLQGFIKEYYLHSIMYLLIRGLHQKRCDHRIQFTFHNVSINSKVDKSHLIRTTSFTFHNVSINSEKASPSPLTSVYLHSIMYLLILTNRLSQVLTTTIYIP